MRIINASRGIRTTLFGEFNRSIKKENPIRIIVVTLVLTIFEATAMPCIALTEGCAGVMISLADRVRYMCTDTSPDTTAPHIIATDALKGRCFLMLLVCYI